MLQSPAKTQSDTVERRRPMKRSRPRRALRTKRRDDDVSPTVSVSSTKTCFEPNNDLPFRRQTRAMKRFRSDNSLSEALEDEDSQPTKRTRTARH